MTTPADELAKKGGAAPAGAAQNAGSAGTPPAAPGADPFAGQATFDPSKSLKAQTRRRGLVLLAVGSVLAAICAVIAFAIIVLSGQVRFIWLAAPVPGLAIAGKGLIEVLHSRDM